MGKWRMGVGLCFIIGILTVGMLLSNSKDAQAGGGGILVDEVQVCLNGARFDAMLVDVIAQNHPMETLVHTLNPYSEVGHGENYTFSDLGEKQTFMISYPSSRVRAGDSVAVVLLSLDGSLSGGGGLFTVESCLLPETDGRLNRDLAAPVVIYQQETVEVYAVMPEESEGELVISFSLETLDAGGVAENSGQPRVLATSVNPANGLPIDVYRLETGEFQVVTYYANGKPYIFRWHPDQPFDGTYVAW